MGTVLLKWIGTGNCEGRKQMFKGSPCRNVSVNISGWLKKKKVSIFLWRWITSAAAAQCDEKRERKSIFTLAHPPRPCWLRWPLFLAITTPRLRTRSDLFTSFWCLCSCVYSLLFEFIKLEKHVMKPTAGSWFLKKKKNCRNQDLLYSECSGYCPARACWKWLYYKQMQEDQAKHAR